MALWAPGAISAAATKAGRRQLARVVKNQAHAVQRKALPAILTLKHLSLMAGVEFKALRDFVRRSDDPYVGFRIKKRKGGRRNIVSPSPPLKRVQRWLAQHVLSRAKPHEASKAYAPGCSTVDVAKLHCGSRWLIKIDIVSFFESISEIDVYRAFRNCGYSSLISFELARICTRVTQAPRYQNAPWTVRYRRDAIGIYYWDKIGHVPQGAPTSPMLANLVMFEIDDVVSKLAQKAGLVYTRYSDDLISLRSMMILREAVLKPLFVASRESCRNVGFARMRTRRQLPRLEHGKLF